MNPLMQPLNAKLIYNLMTQDHHDNWKNIWKSCSCLLILEFSILIIQSVWRYFFRKLCDSLMLRLRSQTYNFLITQPIKYFDQAENSTGNIVSILSTEMRQLKFIINCFVHSSCSRTCCSSMRRNSHVYIFLENRSFCRSSSSIRHDCVCSPVPDSIYTSFKICKVCSKTINNGFRCNNESWNFNIACIRRRVPFKVRVKP